jgi:hypothetical protein
MVIHLCEAWFFNLPAPNMTRFTLAGTPQQNGARMPAICQFFGIVIRMYYNDHQPAHFHADYGEDEALYEIETLRLLQGRLPRRAHNLVLEWADTHRAELMANWYLARSGQPLVDIDPLA